MELAPPPDPFEEPPLHRDPVLLKMCRIRREELDLSQNLYREAIIRAKSAGFKNTEIARACGRTEAAIRMYFKRVAGD